MATPRKTTPKKKAAPRKKAVVKKATKKVVKKAAPKKAAPRKKAVATKKVYKYYGREKVEVLEKNSTHSLIKFASGTKIATPSVGLLARKPTAKKLRK